MNIEQLDRDLRSLATDIQWPAASELTPRVSAAISTRTAPRTVRWADRLRPVLIGAAVVVVITIGVLVLSPAARTAVASWFGLGGVAVERTTEASSPATSELDLGDPTTLEAAKAEVDFPVRGVQLDDPQVYFDPSVPGGMVSFVYPPQAGAPATGTPGVGAILSIFSGDTADPTFTKSILDAEHIDFVPFGGDRFALWASGPSHLILRNDNGQPLRHTARLSANALVWTARDEVTYRLESALDLQAAVALAKPLR